ncbi:phosphatidylglycerol lysyltransferase domain-containing protein [uncultured Tateyamaria sp.]|uniref:phosphatidylglycerol lysyltransferase domain-containing protein n=1 Tax=uncultured Tateyamaria sp. TaxID=455651 RepID=UPI0026207279|nr:phosphatidylglycerol lysyltransferase domain-containing protein [uncultured Tateyamaria sp.]
MHRIQALAVVRTALRVGMPMMILVACVMLLARQIPMDVVASLPQQLADISILQWGLAAVLTLGSFFAVAQYDVQAHRTLGTGVPEGQARITGAVGIAIGQTVGFGLVSGALARWRMLPGMSVTQALKLSTLVSLTFVVAWAGVTGLVSAVLPAPAWTIPLSVGAVALLPACAALLFWCPTLRIGRQTIPLPSLRIAGSILIWALVDMALAAAALWVLLPSGTMAFEVLLPLFMVALGCGLMSNTPGGVGPFELILVSALPAGAGFEAGVLAAILAFRIVYYAAPACLAILAMLRPLPAVTKWHQAVQPWQALPRSEAQALRQNGGQVDPATSGSSTPIWPTSQTRTLFTDPEGRADTSVLTWLCGTARAHGRIPLLYKSGQRLAQLARSGGWAVLHIADDAIIDLVHYDIDTPLRRRLRRKLRAARKAGITLRSDAPLPPQSAANVDAEWQAQCGSARGGSMGRYCPNYISQQRVVSAYSGNKLVGFATFHHGPSDWCLDIMRQGTDAPDGTMHALVHQALMDAKAMGCMRVSLASVTACPDPASPMWRWAAQVAVRHAGGTGLRQFKSAFAPRWVPRYAAAPTWAGLVLGLADIARTVHAPDPLPNRMLEANANVAHYEDENYELASRSAA